MLESVSGSSKSQGKYLVFSNIKRYDTGVGICYVCKVVLKTARNGKPFATLYLRDAEGNIIPGYVFDLSKPLLAGGEATEVTNRVVNISWQENYLAGIGLTLILDSVQIVLDATHEDYLLFQGAVEDPQLKKNEIIQYFSEKTGMSLTLPMTTETYSSPEFCGGKQGGLLEYFWKVSIALRGLRGLSSEEERRIAGVFAVYIALYSSYLGSSDRGEDSIVLANAMTRKVSALAETLKLGPAALEVVHMFFGYEPKDIYVRTVLAVAKTVHRVEKEFTLYHTIPLNQEGDAGYGKIRRYEIE